MSVMGDIKSSIINSISTTIPSARVVEEFNPRDIHGIGKEPLICIYVKRVESRAIALGDVLSFEYDGSSTSTYSGKQFTATLGMDIYMRCGNGTNQSAAGCDLLFEQIAELVMFNDDISASAISRGEIQFKQSYQAYMLTAELLVDDIFSKNEQGLKLNGFRLEVNSVQ